MDSSTARVTQVQAAHRQLEGAIRLHFANSDPVVVHSIVANAMTLLTDLAQRTAPEREWRAGSAS